MQELVPHIIGYLITSLRTEELRKQYRHARRVTGGFNNRFYNEQSSEKPLQELSEN